MRLFIAEKPSVAKAIAGELDITGKGDGYIECGADTVTWCFGHLLEPADPDEYTPNVPRPQGPSRLQQGPSRPVRMIQLTRSKPHEQPSHPSQRNPL